MVRAKDERDAAAAEGARLLLQRDASSQRLALDPKVDATGALHDVSNALTLLLGWVGEARASQDESALANALTMIEQRARVARDLARRAIGASPPVTTDGPLEGVLDEVIGSLAAFAQRARVRLAKPSGDAAGVRVVGAADVAQVLSNLLMNAVAWTPADGEVAVDVSIVDAEVVIDVKDTGPGVDAARAESVFTGDSTRKGGSGVGLRHARAVARAAGGDLELVLQGERLGACFRLTWPRADVAVVAGPMSASRLPLLAGTRVLVVEDDPDVASLLETALGARGAEVTIVRHARDLAAARTGYDAALVDLSPIAEDVEGAIELLRKGSPGVHVVFISGTAVGLPDVLSEANVRWVRKPFEVSEIVAALSEAPRRGAKP